MFIKGSWILRLLLPEITAIISIFEFHKYSKHEAR
jgi:hypothetical protein